MSKLKTGERNSYKVALRELTNNLSPEEREWLREVDQISAEDITKKRKRVSLSSGCYGDLFRKNNFQKLSEEYSPDETSFMNGQEVDLSYLGQNGKCLVIDGSYTVVPV